MNLSFFIAKRYLISKKSNNAINVISWISIIAIAVTTAALVIVLSAMNGLTAVVADLYNAIEPDLKITAINSKYITNKQQLTNKIKSIPGVKGISYSIEENALIKLDDQQAVITVKGVDSEFKNLTQFDTVVVEGVYRFSNNNQLDGVFGKGIANKLGININDFVYDDFDLLSLSAFICFSHLVSLINLVSKAKADFLFGNSAIISKSKLSKFSFTYGFDVKYCVPKSSLAGTVFLKR